MAGNLTVLETALLDWTIDQGLGTKVGNQITPVINPLATAIEGGATIEQALLSTVLVELGAVKTTNATLALLLPVLVELVTAIEGGATIEQALLSSILSELGAVKTTNATLDLLLPVITSLVVAIEGGKTIQQALTALVATA